MADYGPMWVPFNFLGLNEEQSRLDRARIVVVPVPYDGTTSFKSGARDGPRAIIEASYHLEDYDPELDVDVSQVGIHTAPSLEPHMEGPRHMIDRVRDAVHPFLGLGKLVALLGGEHSISTGHVQALAGYYPDLSVLYLDGHADLRNEYMGTSWGHASVARRISEICPLVQVGIRSLSEEERDFIRHEGLSTFSLAHIPSHWRSLAADHPGGIEVAPPVSKPLEPNQSRGGGQSPPFVNQVPAEEIVSHLSPHVHVSIDLDVLDPSIMSAVGTPEPGGMDWHQITSLLRAVAEARRIVGFDVTELSPSLGPTACGYIAAKLVFKLLAYATLLPGGSDKPATTVQFSKGQNLASS